jgi:O-antigen/teichoic acid export membrane protein
VKLQAIAPTSVQSLAPVGQPARKPATRASFFAGDTLAQSVVALLVLAVAQRFIGFGRSVLVCRWLTPAELGQWDLANRFFVLAAPLVVLGLPGSFGRYLEHYRQRGALRSVLVRTATVCAVLSLVAVTGLLLAPQFVADQVFGSADRASTVTLLAVGLISVIAYNFLTETLTALRLVRASSLVQFCNTLAFAALSVVFLSLWRLDATAIVLAYSASCLLLVLFAVVCLLLRAPLLPRDSAYVSSREMWRKLLPFAAWVWVINALFNLFEVVDRYMVLHFGNLPGAQALVGQYHSAQVIPVLIVSVAGMLAGMILPHLTRDWETGRRERVSDTLNLTLKLLSIAVFAGSVVVLVAAPLLFDFVWQGKYAAGLALLPLALASCGWLGLSTVAQMYLWCAERAVLASVSLAIGLALNIALNLALIPAYGLAGAVAATTTSNFAMLGVMFALNRWLGMRVQPQTVAIALLPLALLWGKLIAVLVLTITVVCLLLPAGRLLTADERGRVAEVWRGCRLKLISRSRTPQSSGLP